VANFLSNGRFVGVKVGVANGRLSGVKVGVANFFLGVRALEWAWQTFFGFSGR